METFEVERFREGDGELSAIAVLLYTICGLAPSGPEARCTAPRDARTHLRPTARKSFQLTRWRNFRAICVLGTLVLLISVPMNNLGS